MASMQKIDDTIYIEEGYRKEELDIAMKKYGLDNDANLHNELRKTMPQDKTFNEGSGEPESLKEHD